MTASTALAERPSSDRHLAQSTQQDDFVILDPRSATGVAAEEQSKRINAIATISAGKRGDNGQPIRTQHGEMFIHGEAPGLASVLEQNGGKHLTVMFPSDRPRDFIQQRFTEYSATALKAYGDEHQVTLINGENRATYTSKQPEYADIIARCKVSVSVYFMLAEWTDDSARLVFPDAVGLYRLRFTSLNSLRSILSSVQHMQKLTGRISGIPFDIFLRQEERTDPKGQKRRVWIWQCGVRRPGGVKLDAPTLRHAIESGREQCALLQLQAPLTETLEEAIAEAPLEDLDEAAIEAAQEGGYCDADYFNRLWHATVAGTRFQNDDDRHAFVKGHTKGKCSGLSVFLPTATTEEANALIEAVRDVIKAEATPPETMPPAEEFGDGATVAQFDAAVNAFDALCKEAATVGINTKPLPNSATYETILKWTESLRAAIARRRADAEAEAGPIVEGEVMDAAPSAPSADAPTVTEDAPEMETRELTPIGQAQVAVGNRKPPQPRPKAQPAAAPAAPSETPKHLEKLAIDVANAGIDVEWFFNDPAALASINDALAAHNREPVKSANDLSPTFATLVASQIVRGEFNRPEATT